MCELGVLGAACLVGGERGTERRTHTPPAHPHPLRPRTPPTVAVGRVGVRRAVRLARGAALGRGRHHQAGPLHHWVAPVAGGKVGKGWVE